MQTTPSVQISETEIIINENYPKNAVAEVAAFVGHFERGPIGIPTFITTIKAFVQTFGNGVNDTYNDWQQVYNYLSYSSGIWVTRESGANRVNSSNTTLGLAINNNEHWLVQEPSIPVQNFIDVFAKTPGTWGNNISVAFITSTEYLANEMLGFGITAKKAFSFIKNEHFGICVFNNGVLVETFHKHAGLLTDLNVESAYIYIKYDNINLPSPIVNLIDLSANSGQLNMRNLINTTTVADLQPAAGSTNINVDLGLLTGTYNYSMFTFFGATLMHLSGGINDLPGFVELSDAYVVYEDMGLYDIDIVIGNERLNSAAVMTAEVRRDCLAYIGLPISLIERVIPPFSGAQVLSGVNALSFKPTFNAQIKKLTPSEFGNILSYIGTIPNSMFTCFIVNVKIQYDKFTDKARLVNLAGDFAGLKAQAAQINPWIPGAGLTHGNIKNINANFLQLTQGQREELYGLGLNLTKQNIVDTQKTYITQLTTFNRINVRSMFNHVERDIRKLMLHRLFSLNTLENQDALAKQITTYLENVQAARGLVDFRVLVSTDPTNPNAILADITIKPAFIAEIIKINMTNTGVTLISIVAP